jgi:hypothetical protein
MELLSFAVDAKTAAIPRQFLSMFTAKKMTRYPSNKIMRILRSLRKYVVNTISRQPACLRLFATQTLV